MAKGDTGCHGAGFFRFAPSQSAHLCHYHCGIHAVHTYLTDHNTTLMLLQGWLLQFNNLTMNTFYYVYYNMYSFDWQIIIFYLLTKYKS